mgnify:CR=1 FL=1
MMRLTTRFSDMSRTLRATLFSVFVASLPAVGGAQEPPRLAPPPSTIQVSGDATVSAQPDRVQIDIGVATQAQQSQAAAEQNAKQAEALLAALRKVAGKTAQITTIGYSLQPNYRYPRDGGEPTITGYTATNIVRVRLDELSRIGNVIDTATQSGANRIQGIQFMLKDERGVRSQALREAVTNARAKADALAAALGVKVVGIHSVVESGPMARPVRDVMYARAEMAGATATPIEAGAIEVRADVLLTVQISP